MTAALVPVPAHNDLMTLDDLGHQVGLVQQAMRLVMKPETHYGIIPGVEKPSLWKPGAEVLISLFNLDVDFIETKATDEPTFILREYKCVITHPSGRKRSALGSCSSRESKYGFRTANRKCPKCQKETIIRGKEEYGGGWLCFKKKDGCGAKFAKGDKAIESQEVGKTAVGEAVWEQHNTIVKMAQKRALIAAVLNATAASDIFTQDVEDFAEYMAPPKGFDTKPDAAPADKAAVEAHGGVDAAEAAAEDVESRAPKGLLDKLAKHFDWLETEDPPEWLAERFQGITDPEHLSKEQVTQAIAELERDVAAAMPPDPATGAQIRRFHAAARNAIKEPRADLYKAKVKAWLWAMFQIKTTKFLTEKTMSEVIEKLEAGEMPGNP